MGISTEFVGKFWANSIPVKRICEMLCKKLKENISKISALENHFKQPKQADAECVQISTFLWPQEAGDLFCFLAWNTQRTA